MTTDTTETTENSPTTKLHEQLSNKLSQLDAALKSNTNVGFDMATELRYIHKSLLENPQVTYLLTDEQIGTMVKGFSKESSIVILAPKPKTKSTKAMSLDDF